MCVFKCVLVSVSCTIRQNRTPFAATVTYIGPPTPTEVMHLMYVSFYNYEHMVNIRTPTNTHLIFLRENEALVQRGSLRRTVGDVDGLELRAEELTADHKLCV